MSFLENPSGKIVCINDVQMPDEKYSRCRKTLLSALENMYPDKSRFEI